MLFVFFFFFFSSRRRHTRCLSDWSSDVCSSDLFFGRPTLGSLLVLLPGSKDLFLRRFLVGVQLSGLFFAGVGVAQVATWVVAGATRVIGARGVARRGTVVGSLALGCIAMGALVPAWSFIVGQTDRNASFISEQHSAAPAVAQLDALVATINTKGGGRAFAGDPSDWGAYFTVGEVPVYEYRSEEHTS